MNSRRLGNSSESRIGGGSEGRTGTISISTASEQQQQGKKQVSLGELQERGTAGTETVAETEAESDRHSTLVHLKKQKTLPGELRASS